MKGKNKTVGLVLCRRAMPYAENCKTVGLVSYRRAMPYADSCKTVGLVSYRRAVPYAESHNVGFDRIVSQGDALR